MDSITMTTYVPANTDSRKARHTCWTLNNYTQEDLERCKSYAEAEAAYMCWSQEVGEDNGTPHLQGYTCWSSPRSLNKFKKAIAPELHYEPYTNGTAKQNRDYCLGMVEKKGNKENPTFVEFGEVPHQGERTDWKKALEDLKDADVLTTINNQPHLLPSIRALQTYKQMGTQGKHRDVEVIVICGESGSGKTRYAYNRYPDLYSKPDGPWFDGYTGQETILLDDYYGGLPYSQLLKVLDRYPLVLPVKGGFVSADYTRVIITSNKPYDMWYPDHKPDALRRRINKYWDSTQHAEVPTYPPPPPPPCPPPPPDCSKAKGSKPA